MQVAPGSFMRCRRILALPFAVFLLVTTAIADNQKQPSSLASLEKAPPISKETRMNLIRAFNAELVYIRSPFPMGKTGLKLENGVITPDREQLQLLMATYGPAAKPGDMAMISDIVIKDRLIHFEINGGPVKKKKWYQRIEVGGMGGTVPVAPSDSRANPRGSFVDLVFERSVPEMTPQQLKDLLRPVFDFNSKSAVEAYLETVPPKVKEAIKNHNVLVGMNREMVIYSKGRPPKKIREKDGQTDYEDWIYGEPPQDVDFVRVVGDEVIRVETMKVSGEKVVRDQKEVELGGPTVASAAQKENKAVKAPTLRRPGEEAPNNGSTPVTSTPPPITRVPNSGPPQ